MKNYGVNTSSSRRWVVVFLEHLSQYQSDSEPDLSNSVTHKICVFYQEFISIFKASSASHICHGDRMWNMHCIRIFTLFKCRAYCLLNIIFCTNGKLVYKIVSDFKRKVRTCTGIRTSDLQISIKIILITYFSTVVPLTSCVFCPVGLSSLTRHFQQV